MTLFLRHLTLSHFRSHRVARLDFDGRPVTLFGPNGAGKTNLVEAVSLLSPGRGLRRATAEELIRRPEAIGWKLRAEVQRGADTHEIESWAEPGQPRQVRLDGKATSQTALGRIVRMVWLIPAMDRLWIEGAEGRRRFLDRITLGFHPGHAEASLSYEKAMRDRNRLLKDEVRDPRWYDALEHQMAEAGAAITAARASTVARLAAAQDPAQDPSQHPGAEATFPVAALTLVSGLPDGETGANSLRALLADGRAADLRAGRTLQGPHRADLQAVYAAKGVPAAQSSTGEQKALLLSLIFASARALADDFGAPPILLLDEVAAHLDAGRRAALFDALCALGAQAFLTGTGPELFAELGGRAQHLCLSEDAGTSTVALVAPPPGP